MNDIRYRIIYCKTGFPMTTWAKTLEQANVIVSRFKSMGYDVSIWAYNSKGCHKVG